MLLAQLPAPLQHAGQQSRVLAKEARRQPKSGPARGTNPASTRMARTTNMGTRPRAPEPGPAACKNRPGFRRDPMKTARDGERKMSEITERERCALDRVPQAGVRAPD